MQSQETLWQSKAYTIQRLRMENELLRDFMQFMGRR